MDKKVKNLVFEIISIVVGVGICVATPPAGLERNAMIFFGLLVWTIINWVLNIFPSYATGFILLTGLVVTKTLGFSQAFSVYSGETFWLIVSIFAIGAAVSSTGLLNRVCTLLMTLFPPTYKGQILAMLAGGFVVAPFMPSTSAKVAIAGGFSTRIAEMLGFKDKGKGMNGLWCAMYTGFCLLAPIWMTATFWSYLITGLLTPEEAAPFGFGGWFIAMLPWAIIMFIASFFIISIMYKDTPTNQLDTAAVKKMLSDLGPMSVKEKKTAIVLLACVVMWCLERKVGISSGVTAVIGMSVLMMMGIFTAADLKKLNWPILLYLGPILVLSTATSACGINDWIGVTFGDTVGKMISNPYVLVIFVGIATQLLHFVLVSGASCITVLLAILIPFCQAAGINPWFAGIVSLAMAQPWYLRYMNGNTVGAFACAGGDDKISWNGTVPYCFVYHIVCIGALLVSVPYWKILGLL